MDVSALLLRDYHDLTRQELIARLRQVKLLQARVTYTHDNLSPRVMQALGVAITPSCQWTGVHNSTPALLRWNCCGALRCVSLLVGLIRCGNTRSTAWKKKFTLFTLHSNSHPNPLLPDISRKKHEKTCLSVGRLCPAVIRLRGRQEQLRL